MHVDVRACVREGRGALVRVQGTGCGVHHYHILDGDVATVLVTVAFSSKPASGRMCGVRIGRRTYGSALCLHAARACGHAGGWAGVERSV